MTMTQLERIGLLTCSGNTKMLVSELLKYTTDYELADLHDKLSTGLDRVKMELVVRHLIERVSGKVVYPDTSRKDEYHA